MNKPENQIIIFKTKDQKISVDVRFGEETAWLTLDQMAALFERDKSTISRHIKNVFDEGELDANSVVVNFATTAADVGIAKNYLNEKELQILNLLVSQFLDYAELQAIDERAMTMDDWIKELDKQIVANRRSVLTGKGGISHKQAVDKAEKELGIYRAREMKKLKSDFDVATKQLAEKKGGRPPTSK